MTFVAIGALRVKKLKLKNTTNTLKLEMVLSNDQDEKVQLPKWVDEISESTLTLNYQVNLCLHSSSLHCFLSPFFQNHHQSPLKINDSIISRF